VQIAEQQSQRGIGGGVNTPMKQEPGIACQENGLQSPAAYLSSFCRLSCAQEEAVSSSSSKLLLAAGFAAWVVCAAFAVGHRWIVPPTSLFLRQRHALSTPAPDVFLKIL
jgi:hypothetical protein